VERAGRAGVRCQVQEWWRASAVMCMYKPRRVSPCRSWVLQLRSGRWRAGPVAGLAPREGADGSEPLRAAVPRCPSQRGSQFGKGKGRELVVEVLDHQTLKRETVALR